MKTNTQLRHELLEGQFLIVGSGEGYDSKVVNGNQLFEQWCKLLYGSVEDASDKDVAEDIESLNDEDGWCHDNDTGIRFTCFKFDIGETGHIEIRRITNTP